MGAGEDEFGAAIALRHFREIELQRGVRTITLVGDLLLTRHKGVGAAEVHHDLVGLHALNAAGNDLANATGVLREDELPLGFAEALEHDLLRRLRGDAPGRGKVCDDLNDIVYFDVGLEFLGFAHSDLAPVVLDFGCGLDHALQNVDRDLAIARDPVAPRGRGRRRRPPCGTRTPAPPQLRPKQYHGASPALRPVG